MKTFFTSDLHFDSSLFKIRPLSGPEWDAYMLDTLNKNIARQDRLFILGDFSPKRPGFWRTKIRCKNVMLILGNHDSEAKCRRVFGGNLKITHTMKLCGKFKTILSHYPMAYWDGSHRGSLHLYGHCHSQREETLDQMFPERRSMDVSPENAFLKLGEWRPFEDVEIYDLLKRRLNHDGLAHYFMYQDAFVKNTFRGSSTGRAGDC